MDPHTKVTKQEFFSRRALNAGRTEGDLELYIKSYDNDAVVHMELINRQHGFQCREQLHRIWLLISLGTIYFACAWKYCTSKWDIPILVPSIVLVILSVYILNCFLSLVQSEKLFYSWDLALQIGTVRTFGRETVQCIQRGHLCDMVINEVIENLDVKYVLIARTKGAMFKRNPIIPIFNNHSPSFKCLQHIYRTLHRNWLHNDDYYNECRRQGYNISKPRSVAS